MSTLLKFTTAFDCLVLHHSTLLAVLFLVSLLEHCHTGILKVSYVSHDPPSVRSGFVAYPRNTKAQAPTVRRRLMPCCVLWTCRPAPACISKSFVGQCICTQSASSFMIYASIDRGAVWRSRLHSKVAIYLRPSRACETIFPAGGYQTHPFHSYFPQETALRHCPSVMAD